MKYLLPQVNHEVGFSVAHSIGNQYDRDFVKKELNIIKKENPAVAEFIKKWSLGKLHTAFCGILVYKLLRSQAEVDRMTEDFNGNDK